MKFNFGVRRYLHDLLGYMPTVRSDVEERVAEERLA